MIPHLLERSEFYTAYTPYQPEISQGTLQYIFEYQSMISELTGLEATNASMYDGATATAEAAFMMVASARKRNCVLVSETLAPRVTEVVRTYMKFHGVEMRMIPERDGVTVPDAMREMVKAGDVAGVILPQPNKYGIVEDFTGVAEAVHAEKALLTINADPSALAVLRSPAEWGAAIACGTCGRRDCRCFRQALLCSYTAGTRTAYTPRESHQQYLLQPESDGSLCHNLPCPDGRIRPA